MANSEPINIIKRLLFQTEENKNHLLHLRNMIFSVKNTTDRKKSKKHNRKSKKNSINKASCDPTHTKYRATIPKDFTENTDIRNMVRQPICNVYKYLDASIGLQCNDGQLRPYVNKQRNEYLVVNLDLSHKKTGEALYGVLNKKQRPTNNTREYKMRTDPPFVTADKLRLRGHKIPASSRTKLRKHHSNDIRGYTFDKDGVKNILKKKIQWSHFPVYKRENNKKRMTLGITKEELIPYIEAALRGINHKTIKELIPIVMFGENAHWIEYILRVHIKDKGADIGVSLRYNGKANDVQITGIHLDKEMIYEQHELIDSIAPYDRHCLDEWRFVIDDFQAGNPDHYRNEMKNYETRYLTLRDFLYRIINAIGPESYKAIVQEAAQLLIAYDKGDNIMWPESQSPVTPVSVSSAGSTPYSTTSSSYARGWRDSVDSVESID